MRLIGPMICATRLLVVLDFAVITRPTHLTHTSAIESHDRYATVRMRRALSRSSS